MTTGRWRAGRVLGAGLATVALCAACTGDGSGAADARPAEAAATSTTSGTTTASDVAPRCSVASLSGRYLYEIHGNRKFSTGLYPYLEVGEEVYDGQGHVTNAHTTSLDRSELTAKGTYTMDTTCHGVVTYDSGTVLRMVASPAGEEFTTYDADGKDPQADLDGGATRASTDPAATCSASTLSGTYSYRSRGYYDRELHIEQGFETFASGAVTNSYVLGGSPDKHYLTGTYEVTPDCRATVRYKDGPTFTQYLSPDGAEFLWLEIAGFAKDDVSGFFGGHEHRVTTSTDPALTKADA